MILSITDPLGGQETYEIKLDSSLRDPVNGKPVNILMLTNSSGESMSLHEAGIFRMIDDYFKKYY